MSLHRVRVAIKLNRKSCGIETAEILLLTMREPQTERNMMEREEKRESSSQRCLRMLFHAAPFGAMLCLQKKCLVSTSINISSVERQC